MKLSNLMAIKAVSALITGVIVLAVPDLIAQLVGLTGNESSAIYGRLFGAAVIGICCLTWFSRNCEDSVARRVIILDLFIYDLIAFISLITLQLVGMMNAFGWIFVVIYLFFALSFGYFLLPYGKVYLSPHQ